MKKGCFFANAYPAFGTRRPGLSEGVSQGRDTALRGADAFRRGEGQDPARGHFGHDWPARTGARPSGTKRTRALGAGARRARPRQGWTDGSRRSFSGSNSLLAGGVTASDTLYHELKKFKRDTGSKVVAHVMDMGTSGAYYAALAADRIMAQPTSVTGRPSA